MVLMTRLSQITKFTIGLLLAVSYSVDALQAGSDFSSDIRGFYPVIDEVAAYGDRDTWQVGMRLTIPQVVTPKLGVNNHDGRMGTYAFIDRDDDDSLPVPFGEDLSHSTIHWYVVPRGTTRATYEGLNVVAISPSLSGPMLPGEKVLIGTGSSITVPNLALGNQIGFDITPITAIGNPYQSPKVIVPDIRFMQGQIDPNEPNVIPEPDPEEPLVKNPGVPEEELPPDPTIGQPKIYIFRLDEWNEYGLDAIPVDTLTDNGFAEVEVDTDYIARVIRDENSPHTASLLDDTDVTDRLTVPINWYLYSFDGEQLIPNAIDPSRLRDFAEPGIKAIYHTQRDNDQATAAAKSTEEKSEQKLKLRVGFIWDPDDTVTWPVINQQ